MPNRARQSGMAEATTRDEWEGRALALLWSVRRPRGRSPAAAQGSRLLCGNDATPTDECSADGLFRAVSGAVMIRRLANVPKRSPAGQAGCASQIAPLTYVRGSDQVHLWSSPPAINYRAAKRNDAERLGRYR